MSGFKTIKHFATTSSTMDEAEQLLQAGSAYPILVTATEQTNGRGRFGRTWESSAGGAYMTAIFNIQSTVFTAVPIVAAVALGETLQKIGLRAFYYKWPNDILSIEGVKIAGVLCQLIQCTGQNFVSIGIGVNVSNTPSLKRAGTLFELGIHISTTELLSMLTNQLLSDISSYFASGLDRFRELWLQKAWLLGQHVLVDIGANEIISGTHAGIDKDGFLTIKLATGEQQRIISGSIIC